MSDKRRYWWTCVDCGLNGRVTVTKGGEGRALILAARRHNIKRIEKRRTCDAPGGPSIRLDERLIPVAEIVSKQLADRVIEYVGGHRPDPMLDCDRELYDLATRMLSILRRGVNQ